MLQASKFFKPLSHCGHKKSENESLPEPKEESKEGRSDEIHASLPDLKHSVSLPKELASATVIKSESTSGTTQFIPDPKLMDHGQSHPDDKDMYSTRS